MKKLQLGRPIIEKQNTIKFNNLLRDLSARVSLWKILMLIVVALFFGLSIRWSSLDNRPPAWDQGLYLYQSTVLHKSLVENGFSAFLSSLFNIDRGRVPFILILVQPLFWLFGPSLDAAVISINFFWFLLAWSLFGLAREMTGSRIRGEKAGFFAFILFAVYPLTTMVSHNFLVEFPLVTLICSTVYSLWMAQKTKKRIWFFWGGIFLSLGLLTKVTFPAFVGPIIVYLLYKNIRQLQIWKTLKLFSPIFILPIVLVGPYYFYNFRQIIQSTLSLSSHSLAQLYGFGGALDPYTVGMYIYGVLYNPAMVIAFYCIFPLLISQIFRSRKNIAKKLEKTKINNINVLMAIWFTIPFVMAAFGEIKDPRYIYPSLIPIFILAGVSVARFFKSGLALSLLTLFYLIPLYGYLQSNLLVGEGPASLFKNIFQAVAYQGQTDNEPPDDRNWKTKELVSGIAESVGKKQEAKKIFFLGGNRYYHLRLLDFEGLVQGYKLNYIVLPYYSKPSMSVDEALSFIENISPDGILYKSGENWPEFSSRLDSKIIARFKSERKYRAVDLSIEQPDGSRFTLFIPSSENYFFIKSSSDLVGDWSAGEGKANIAPGDDNRLILSDEKGERTMGEIQNGEISVPEWKVVGRLTEDLKKIYWSNGFKWRKSP